MLISRIQRVHVALALALTPVAAFAQPVSMPTQVSDVLSFDVAGGFEHHSNIFRLRDGPSDTVLRGLFGVRFERDVSLQRFAAYLNLEPVKYLDFSRYDYLGYGAGATWDWEVGRPVFGQVAVRYTRAQTPFDSIGLAQNNIQDLLFMRALAGFRITQSWSAIGALDYSTTDNSLITQRSADFERLGVEVGMRYAPGNATELDVVWRREDGEFPNRQVFDSVGNLLPAAVDNAYAQDALLLRIGYRPTDATRVVGNIGYTRRSYENIAQRDFSGVTAGLDFEWPLSGAVLMRASVFRSIDTAELLTSNYIDVTGIALRPTWQASGRVSIDGVLGYANRAYNGDPGFVFTGAEVREDKLLELGVRVNYELARRVFLFADLRTLERSSNYAEFDFTDNWFGLGVRAAF
jgi:exopolysaccharide biosynthesis operon protein EpsL